MAPAANKRKRAPPALFIREQQQQHQQQQPKPQQNEKKQPAAGALEPPAAKKPKISCNPSSRLRPIVDAIEFRAPPAWSEGMGKANNALIFPPTIDTNVQYKQGVRVRAASIEVLEREDDDDDDDDDDVDVKVKVKVTYNRNEYYNTAATATANATATASSLSTSTKQSKNYTYANDVQPILTPQQAELWNHSYASTAANNLQFPVSKYRFLGSITRSFSIASRTMDKPKARARSRVAHYAKKTARKKTVAPATVRRGMNTDCTANLSDVEARRRVAETRAAWEEALRRSPDLQGQPAPWDAFGNLRPDVANDDGSCYYVPATDLHKWLDKVRQRDDGSVDDDEELSQQLQELVDILEACRDLSDPSQLWKIPLLLVYPTIHIERNDEAAPALTSVTVQLGVYANRLLPMATTKTLKTVMEALDPGSYRVTAPLCQIPQPTEPTFCSSQYPIVTFEDDVEEKQGEDGESVEKENKQKAENQKKGKDEGIDNDGDDDDDNDDDIPDDERKMPAKPDAKSKSYDDWIDDCNNKDTDRDDERASAFSTRGLLKLLENTGVEMSGYAERIGPHLQGLRMKLLPHQEHAIQWMVQMEHLPGAAFGINSLLWEEREFLDGGKYYYCPSLGQLRLEAPADCKGGLLCDEMGLGKTIEVLGLILSTLPELKREAQQQGGSYATLIVVPPALVAQWQTEIIKATGGDALTVHYVDFHPQAETYSRRGGDAQPDIVLTTYRALSVPKVAKQLHETSWGRIVLDEMQEIRSSTTVIAQTCEKLQCNRRWMVSGTPLFESIDDFRGELNFLRLHPFGALCEDGFFDFMITQPWEEKCTDAIEILKNLSSVLLRRTKSMTVRSTGAPLLGLPEMTVEYVPVQQTESERALYCYLEAIVSEELRSKDQNERNKSRILCLRLLRDVCNSAVLLNGGLGVGTQLKDLNQLLIKAARRTAGGGAASASATAGQTTTTTTGQILAPVMSCDEAIMHLAQLQESTRTGTNEVSGLALGFGQGLSRRVRAHESTEQKLAEAEQRLHSAKAENEEAKSKRARARWHLALEQVTMGRLSAHNGVHRVGVKYRTLWRMRSMASAAVVQGSKLPLVLRRGWRPSANMVNNWHKTNPQYFWSHPLAYTISLPSQVSEKEIESCIAEFLESKGAGDIYSLEDALASFALMKIGTSSFYDSYWLVFTSYEAAAAVLMGANRSRGIQITHQEAIPAIESHILQTNAAYKEARDVEKVKPTSDATTQRKKANEAYKNAQLGLKIVSPSAARSVVGDVVMKSARGEWRPSDSDSYHSLLVSSTALVDDLSRRVVATNTAISTEERKIGRFRLACGKEGYGAAVTAMSAFESLQALSNGNAEATSCCICLDVLGSNAGDATGTTDTAFIAMTKCGHLYCRGCLEDCFQASNDLRPQCPACRKEIHASRDVVYVDPSKKDKSSCALARQNAKDKILTLSQAVEESSGCLSPDLWFELYLAIDEPAGADSSLEGRVSALPRHFLAHLREAVAELPILGCAKESPRALNAHMKCISSKVKYLLHNLPKNERSVVFSSSKATIQHLLFVFTSMGIESRALFSGQKVDESESAVAEWLSEGMEPSGVTSFPIPVLLVQAGAAASGLTLTAASKMFLLEPFLHQSEEQQAFGRCHRYGQKCPVQVKVLYTPVSVESRLLAWRKLATATATDTKIVYAKAVDESDDDDDDDNDAPEDETDQTKFLLGLHHSGSGTGSSLTDMDIDYS